MIGVRKLNLEKRDQSLEHESNGVRSQTLEGTYDKEAHDSRYAVRGREADRQEGSGAVMGEYLDASENACGWQ